VIIALANVRKNKRFDILLKAFVLVKKKIPEAKVLVAGTDMLHAQGLPSMKEMAAELKISDSLILTGHQPQEIVRKLYSVSNVFVHPAENEYQGLVSYEAAAMGLPLCLSSIGSHTTVFKEHALYHHYEDFRTLAKNIITSLQHPERREEHIKFLKSHMKNWDYPVMFKRMSEFYDEVLESKRKS
jgi:glycosyltransferase involved in cell wall biosynthesis